MEGSDESHYYWPNARSNVSNVRAMWAYDERVSSGVSERASEWVSGVSNVIVSERDEHVSSNVIVVGSSIDRV
jgi:hypothetical protein